MKRWLRAHELTIMYALMAALVVGGYALIDHQATVSDRRLCEASKVNRAGLVTQIEQVARLGRSVAGPPPYSKAAQDYLDRIDDYRAMSLKALPPLGKDCQA